MKTNFILRGALLAALTLLGTQAVRADLLEQITLITTPLIGDVAGPFSVDFQLNGNNGNTATLSNFTFGAGAAAGTPALIGGATGSLTGGVTLNETGFLNEFTQTFSPGSQLSFDLDLTTNSTPMSFPDEFTFAILDKTGADLPTKGPFDVFADVIVAQTSTVSTYGSDPTRSPAAGGGPLTIAPASATTPVSSVPEPGNSCLLLLGSLTAARLLQKKR